MHCNLILKVRQAFTKLTPSPAVQVASSPWHPDLEQRCLCKIFMLCGYINCQSHVACEAGRGVNNRDTQSCDLCAYVCRTEH